MIIRVAVAVFAAVVDSTARTTSPLAQCPRLLPWRNSLRFKCVAVSRTPNIWFDTTDGACALCLSRAICPNCLRATTYLRFKSFCSKQQWSETLAAQSLLRKRNAGEVCKRDHQVDTFNNCCLHVTACPVRTEAIWDNNEHWNARPTNTHASPRAMSQRRNRSLSSFIIPGSSVDSSKIEMNQLTVLISDPSLRSAGHSRQLEVGCLAPLSFLTVLVPVILQDDASHHVHMW